jgi:hypothetical protein
VVEAAIVDRDGLIDRARENTLGFGLRKKKNERSSAERRESIYNLGFSNISSSEIY